MVGFALTYRFAIVSLDDLFHLLFHHLIDCLDKVKFSAKHFLNNLLNSFYQMTLSVFIFLAQCLAFETLSILSISPPQSVSARCTKLLRLPILTPPFILSLVAPVLERPRDSIRWYR